MNKISKKEKVDWKKFLEADDNLQEDVPHKQEYHLMAEKLEKSGILSIERKNNYKILTGDMDISPKTHGWYGPHLYFTREADAVEYAKLVEYDDVSVEKVEKIIFPDKSK